MEKRNFYILIASISVGMSIVWLSIYGIVVLEVDPFWNLNNDGIITITGNVKEDLSLSLEDIKSSKYYQVEDQLFHFINAIGREFDEIYSGASLWSILEVEDVLEADASSFQFIGSDGFTSPKPISLTLAEDNLNLVILAYERDGIPLFEQGPIRSIVDFSVIPSETTTHWAVQNLKSILII